MKKLFILLILTLSTINLCAIDYYSNFISRKELVDNVWLDWTDWEEHYVKISVNDSIIVIDNKTYPVKLIEKTDNITKFKILNSNKFIRLRFQNDGIKQLYLDCENIVYVYNLI